MCHALVAQSKKPARCSPDTSLREMVHIATEGHHHRLWIVDERNMPIGATRLAQNLISTIRIQGCHYNNSVAWNVSIPSTSIMGLKHHVIH